VSATSALILYPSWALAVLLAATAVRLGRSTGRGLAGLCLVHALWVTAVLLVEHPATTALGERLVPSGMLLAGGFVHGGATIVGRRLRRSVWAGYGFGLVTAVAGLIWPWLFFAPGFAAPGPAFWPFAVISSIGAVVVLAWMVRETIDARGPARRGMVLLLAGNLLGVISGGGAVLLRVVGIVGDLRWTAPIVLIAVGLIGAAVLGGEQGRSRRLVRQAMVYALVSASVSAVGLAALFLLLPQLVPAPGMGWMLAVLFFAALPLDGVRQLVVDGVGRRLFRDPIGVRDLADEAARSEARADHVERLAEIGTITSAVAHEVRNPLGVIAAQAKLLERAGAPASSVASLRAQVERARRFVDDLLRYGQPRPLELRDAEVAAIVDAAVQSVRQAVPDAAPITVEVEPGLRIEADRAALGDVLVALVHNAAIAAGDRAGASVRVRASRTDGAVAIAIEDDGPGVPPELEDTLFAPFVTGRGRDHRHPGTGLGLAIARRVMERHGGSLRHERPVGGGARFVIRFGDGGARVG
jgi:signal transduction histidine kinase